MQFSAPHMWRGRQNDITGPSDMPLICYFATLKLNLQLMLGVRDCLEAGAAEGGSSQLSVCGLLARCRLLSTVMIYLVTLQMKRMHS